ncbi:hypothetical protein HDV01_002013 [Terramyces sp. JEL0728]|nr:hypothetical protein HDV01_002013 [Terramyces sp. JEL0728]
MALNTKDKIALLAVVGAFVSAVAYFLSTPNTLAHGRKKGQKLREAKKKQSKLGPKEEPEVQMEAIPSRELKEEAAHAVESGSTTTEFQELELDENSGIIDGTIEINIGQDLSFQKYTGGNSVGETSDPHQEIPIQPQIPHKSMKATQSTMVEIPDYIYYEESNFCSNVINLFLNSDAVYISDAAKSVSESPSIAVDVAGSNQEEEVNAGQCDVKVRNHFEDVKNPPVQVEKKDTVAIQIEVMAREREEEIDKSEKSTVNTPVKADMLLFDEKSNYYFLENGLVTYDYNMVLYEPHCSTIMQDVGQKSLKVGSNKKIKETQQKSVKQEKALEVFTSTVEREFGLHMLEHSEVSTQFYFANGALVFNSVLLDHLEMQKDPTIPLVIPQSGELGKTHSYIIPNKISSKDVRDIKFSPEFLVHSEESNLFYFDSGMFKFDYSTNSSSQTKPQQKQSNPPTPISVKKCASQSDSSDKTLVKLLASQEKQSPKLVFQAPKNIGPNISKFVELYENEAFKSAKSQSEPVKAKISSQKSCETLVNDDDSLSDTTAV